MKVFLLAALVAVVCAVGAEMVLSTYAQQSSEMAYASSTSRP